MELLSRLLGGVDRVKIMRFFLHHDDGTFTPKDIVDKTKSKNNIIRKELGALSAIGFIERKRTRTISKNGKGKEILGYRLNQSFPHNQALKDLLFDFELLDKRELASRFKTVGRIKLFIVSGVFVGEEKSRVDILIVGEAIKKPKAEKILETLSAELGREVVYSIMDVEEYEYRYKMYDKFVRDIFDMPHEKVVDKITEKVFI
ncbi:MAG: seg [Candidatus Nomurabacteria bacterium]|nr:seg [Candidatus Nomurabacteria bacterium]